jgi:Uma2 family endonuclease
MHREIVLPETEPAMEWVLDRAIQKVSPKRPHALLQLELGTVLSKWARGRGEVGTEWRFRLTPRGEKTRLLVPDLAFLSYERSAHATDDDLLEPTIAPDVAVEILSPSERIDVLVEKIHVYLNAGSELVLVVDPRERTVVARDHGGSQSFSETDVFVHRALPDLSFSVAQIFEVLKRP